jgi:hypothetical protein
MYQALDSRLKGRELVVQPGGSGPGPVRHPVAVGHLQRPPHELMNDNPDKVLTSGDAWNDEDLSAVA